MLAIASIALFIAVKVFNDLPPAPVNPPFPTPSIPTPSQSTPTPTPTPTPPGTGGPTRTLSTNTGNPPVRLSPRQLRAGTPLKTRDSSSSTSTIAPRNWAV